MYTGRRNQSVLRKKSLKPKPSKGSDCNRKVYCGVVTELTQSHCYIFTSGHYSYC